MRTDALLAMGEGRERRIAVQRPLEGHRARAYSAWLADAASAVLMRRCFGDGVERAEMPLRLSCAAQRRPVALAQVFVWTHARRP
jgi:hypothetical protein